MYGPAPQTGEPSILLNFVLDEQALARQSKEVHRRRASQRKLEEEEARMKEEEEEVIEVAT